MVGFCHPIYVGQLEAFGLLLTFTEIGEWAHRNLIFSLAKKSIPQMEGSLFIKVRKSPFVNVFHV